MAIPRLACTIALYTKLYNGAQNLQAFIKTGLYGCSVTILLLAWSAPSQSEELNIAVASNFIAAMQSIEQAFEDSTEHELRIIRGSSGKHYAQIRSGAPFDAFLSADQDRPRRLVDEGVAIESSLASYAQGQLALWSRKSSLKLDRKYLLNTNNYKLISMANPRLAPYGQAAIELMSNLGLESSLSGSFVVGENIAQAFQFAFSGNADLGLVAYSQAVSPNLQGEGSVWLVPSELHQPIRQDMVLLTDSGPAWEFAEFMQGTIVRGILLSHGYLVPEGGS